ncbi:MAG TPA: alpha/beta hydrolase-fold protein [Polyangiaceae bacterium]|nr:alpha/beta hydrolase-fold protein [Polyangiaceae bacterium]
MNGPRRKLLAGALAWAAGCGRRQSNETPAAMESAVAPSSHEARAVVLASSDAGASGAESPPTREGNPFTARELVFATSPVGPEKAVAIVPSWGAKDERFPVVVALHGRGEAVRGVDVGAHGWLHDYDLGHAIVRLRSPPLTRDDFRGFVDDERLARINASLADRPFRGVVVACPWVPDLFTDKDRTNLDAALPYGRFVIDQLLPRVVEETPALSDRASTGIDGVSLGGRVALVVGLAHAARFGALGTLQAAIQESEPALLASRAKRAVGDAGSLRLRLVTSDRDYFRGAIGQLHGALAAERIEHEHLVIPGPHDYAFNRGPGGLEMLLWHDRVLRGEPAV